jgi:osmotically inducible protein OsmC
MIALNGSADWSGDIRSGSGTVTVGDGVLQGAYSYGARFGQSLGTNPEQLIAAAQAACYTMALTAVLGAAGYVPESLHTSVRVQLRAAGIGPWLSRLDIETEGDVPGVEEAEFQRFAGEAESRCSVSRALAGIPEIVLTARLVVSALESQKDLHFRPARRETHEEGANQGEHLH